MGGLVEVASTILSGANRDVELRAQNIANLTTPGYKRRRPFAELLAAPTGVGATAPQVSATTDFAEGKLLQTGATTDLAIRGEGFFVLQGADGRQVLTRQGQFQRDDAGRLVTAQGLVLQAEGGGDLRVGEAAFTVAEDGAVSVAGEPVARLGLARFQDPTSAVAVEDGGYVGGPTEAVETPHLHQGALEASNVSPSDEMVGIMAALRRAETGQKLVGVYDDLMGRLMTSLGQA